MKKLTPLLLLFLASFSYGNSTEPSDPNANLETNYEAKSAISSPARTVTVVPVEKQGIIQLALPAWESDFLNFDFKKDQSMIRRSHINAAKFSLSLGVDAGVFALLALKWRNGSYDRLFRLFTFAVVMGHVVTPSIVNFVESIFDKNTIERKRESVKRIILSHADHLCVRGGFGPAPYPTESLTLSDAFQFLRPISLHPEDFDQFKVYLDGELITSERAKQLIPDSETRKKIRHYQFINLYCEE